ncbi:MAG TPA: hypothetical protein VF113_07000 [Stellaceae bacterium]
MSTYRCYFLNKANVIVGVEEIHCASEADVREAAFRLLRERPGYAVEVWDRARKILRLTREPA